MKRSPRLRFVWFVAALALASAAHAGTALRNDSSGVTCEFDQEDHLRCAKHALASTGGTIQIHQIFTIKSPP